MKFIAIGVLFYLMIAGIAVAQTCTAYPNTLTNGTTADANQVMANFNSIQTCANTNLAPLASPHLTGNATIATPASGYALDSGGIGRFESANLGSTGAVIVRDAPGNPQAGYIQFVNNADTAQLGFILGLNASGLELGGGNVGIGTASPSYLLYVNGTAYASGAAGALSDIRHKDNVKTLGAGGLDVVERLRPVTFTWKRPMDDGMKGEQIGFVAQEVQKVLPSVVLTENNSEKTLGIKYTELIPVLAKAIQEQQAEIEQLRAELAAVKGAR